MLPVDYPMSPFNNAAMKEALLVIAALLIVLSIVVQLLKGFVFSRRAWRGGDADPELEQYVKRAGTPGEARQVLRELEIRAVDQDSRLRSRVYSTGGEIALIVLKRPAVAVRYYLRALRANPDCTAAFERLTEVLVAQKKLRRLERVCWDLLSRLGDDGAGSPMWRRCWQGLATVYAATPRMVNRADAIRKMLDFAGPDEDDDNGSGFESDDAPGDCHLPRINATDTMSR